MKDALKLNLSGQKDNYSKNMKSPRYLKSHEKEGVKVTWKSIVQPTISQSYGYFKVEQTKKQPLKMNRVENKKKTPRKELKPMSKSSLKNLVECASSISTGTNTSRTNDKKIYTQKFTGHLTERRKTENQEVCQISLSSLQKTFLQSHFFKPEDEGKQTCSLYHQQLKDEERLYLLQKFMEHYQKIHNKKI